MLLLLLSFDPFSGSNITVPYADAYRRSKGLKEQCKLLLIRYYELNSLTSNVNVYTRDLLADVILDTKCHTGLIHGRPFSRTS